MNKMMETYPPPPKKKSMLNLKINCTYILEIVFRGGWNALLGKKTERGKGFAN